MLNDENILCILENKYKNLDAFEKMNEQFNYYLLSKEEYKLKTHNYNLNDKVMLKKGTLMHGTFKKIDELKEIKENGLGYFFKRLY